MTPGAADCRQLTIAWGATPQFRAPRIRQSEQVAVSEALVRIAASAEWLLW